MEEFYMYRRNLPHWRAPGSIYFVTFRLADSIPQHVIAEWQHERKTWFAAHRITPGLSEGKFKELYEAIPEAVRAAFERDCARKYFLELDRGHGECVLRKPDAAEVVASAMRFFNGARLQCGDFVVMPNHVHWLLMPMNGYVLEDILQSVKSYSANKINKALGRQGGLWQRESHDHIVRDREEMIRIRRYIVNNPDKAQLKSTDYIYSSAELM